MEIKVLGPGCPKCTKLEENVKAAVAELGVDATIEKVTDVVEIAKAAVFVTPGLVVDGQVKSAGKLLSVEDIKKLLA